MLSEKAANVNANSEEVMSCANCGVTDERLYEVDGKFLCAECLKALPDETLARAGYAICEDCGGIFELEDMLETHTGYVCTECGCDYIECENCGRYAPSCDVREVSTRNGWRYATMYVCESCIDRDYRFQRCEDCGEWIDTQEIGMSYVRGVGDVCESCLENYSYCEGCDEYFPDRFMVWVESEDSYYCRDCAAEFEDEADNSKMHDYCYKPTPKPRTHKQISIDSCNEVEELLMGTELEVDKGDNIEDTIREISEVCPDVYMKHDGSLDDGFEIVTHPCTLEYHMKDFKWREICQIAKDNGFKSHDAKTCGLHIHVGRYQLGGSYEATRKTIANVVLLVDRHWDMMVKFSRRKASQLERWARRPEITAPSDGDTEETLIRKAWRADNRNRYQAVNLCNEGTIEFRLFNGTLKRDTIIATTQLVNNICLYAKSHSTKDCLSSNWEDITGYIHYDELDTYLRERGITTADNPDAVDVYDPDEADTRKINGMGIGDTVVTVGDGYGLGSGVIGRIVYIRDSRTFGVEFPTITRGHNLDGVLDDETSHHGWWTPVSYVRPATSDEVLPEPREFHIGDTVRYNGNSYTSMRGMVGTIVSGEGRRSMGVLFPTFEDGHDLDGVLSGEHSTHGWWVRVEELEPAA